MEFFMRKMEFSMRKKNSPWEKRILYEKKEFSTRKKNSQWEKKNSPWEKWNSSWEKWNSIWEKKILHEKKGILYEKKKEFSMRKKNSQWEKVILHEKKGILQEKNTGKADHKYGLVFISCCYDALIMLSTPFSNRCLLPAISLTPDKKCRCHKIDYPPKLEYPGDKQFYPPLYKITPWRKSYKHKVIFRNVHNRYIDAVFKIQKSKIHM